MLNYCKSKVTVSLFTVDTYGLDYKSMTFIKLRVALNIVYRRVSGLPKCSSASEMYATKN